MKLLLKIFKSKWALALAPTALTLWLLPDLSNRYTIVQEALQSGDSHLVFEDLNNDGESELLAIGDYNTIYNGRVIISDQKQNPYDQWNIHDSITQDITRTYFDDYDKDGFKEIYVFSRKRDSIFLNVNEYFDPSGLRIDRAFITAYGHRSINDLNVFPAGMFDEDGDGEKELYFTITSGFGLWPRLVYYYNLEERLLQSSDYTSISLSYPAMKDVDNDGRPEIFGISGASGNHHFPTPFSDYAAWVMVYDADVQFKFNPIGFEGFGNDIETKAIRTSAFSGFVTILNSNPATSREKSRLILITPEGKVLKEKLLEDFGLDEFIHIDVFPYKNEERIFVFSDPLLILDVDLAIVESIDLPDGERPGRAAIIPWAVDIDQDTKTDMFIRLRDETICAVYKHDLELIGTFTLEYGTVGARISTLQTKSGSRTLLMPSNKPAILLSVLDNRYYLLTYLIYPATYVSFVVFLMLVMKITTAQVEKQEQQKRRIQELQLRGIKGQLDPHFTFNALNAIGSMLQLEDRNVAYDYLSKYTRLLRQLIKDSDRIYRTLEEELEFVTAYLQLEKIRFDEKFDFCIHVDEGVSMKEMVPILCIQIFAENAVRHGITPLENGGVVSINIGKENDYLVLSIQDNGIGRKKAGENNPQPGRGLKMTTEFYEILNQHNLRSTSFLIKDHFGGEAFATSVEVRVPI